MRVPLHSKMISHNHIQWLVLGCGGGWIFYTKKFLVVQLGILMPFFPFLTKLSLSTELSLLCPVCTLNHKIYSQIMSSMEKLRSENLLVISTSIID